MPLCGCVGDRILCMHGGLSPQLKDFDQVNIERFDAIHDFSTEQFRFGKCTFDEIVQISTTAS